MAEPTGDRPTDGPVPTSRPPTWARVWWILVAVALVAALVLHALGGGLGGHG